MIKGESVILYERVVTGYDAFNEPIYGTPTEAIIDNVLIAPVSANEIVDAHQLDGRHEVYQLALPKGDAHEWAGNTVSFWGKLWRVFGDAQEGMAENIPLSWNKKIMVERINNGQGV